jgi:hypothetical protein
MHQFLFTQFASMMNNMKDINPAYLDLVKIFTGSIAWIGGLTFYMWRRERLKTAEARA